MSCASLAKLLAIPIIAMGSTEFDIVILMFSQSRYRIQRLDRKMMNDCNCFSHINLENGLALKAIISQEIIALGAISSF